MFILGNNNYFVFVSTTIISLSYTIVVSQQLKKEFSCGVLTESQVAFIRNEQLIWKVAGQTHFSLKTCSLGESPQFSSVTVFSCKLTQGLGFLTTWGHREAGPLE